MGKWGAERLAAASGFVFVGLFLASVLLQSDTPDLSHSRADFVAYFADHVRETKVAAILGGLALIAFLWFLGSLTSALREGGEQRLATVAFSGGIVTASVALVSVGITAALGYSVAVEAPDMAKGLYVTQFIASTLIGFPVAALAYAAAIASWRKRIFPQWYSLLSGLGAAVFLFSGAALAAKGFYAPDGAYALIAFIAFLVWVVLTSGLLMMRSGEQAVAAQAAA